MAQEVELIVSEKITATTLIARPGSSWREIRYHPNYRAYFTSGSEASRQVAARRQARRNSSPTLDIPARKPRLWPVLALTGAALLAIGGYVLGTAGGIACADPGERSPPDRRPPRCRPTAAARRAAQRAVAVSERGR